MWNTSMNDNRQRQADESIQHITNLQELKFFSSFSLVPKYQHFQIYKDPHKMLDMPFSVKCGQTCGKVTSEKAESPTTQDKIAIEGSYQSPGRKAHANHCHCQPIEHTALHKVKGSFTDRLPSLLVLSGVRKYC